MQCEEDEDGPASTRLGYCSLDEHIRTLQAQIKENSAEVGRAEEDISRLQQVCKVLHSYKLNWTFCHDFERRCCHPGCRCIEIQLCVGKSQAPLTML